MVDMAQVVSFTKDFAMTDQTPMNNDEVIHAEVVDSSGTQRNFIHFDLESVGGITKSRLVKPGHSARIFELGAYKLIDGETGHVYAQEKRYAVNDITEFYDVDILYSPDAKTALSLVPEFIKIREKSGLPNIRFFKKKDGVWVMNWFYPYTQEEKEINDRAGSGGAEAFLSYVVNAIRLSGEPSGELYANKLSGGTFLFIPEDEGACVADADAGG